jgi:repressor LexA
LAEYLDLNPATISRYVNGLMKPKMPTVGAIADKYKVNPLWLMGQPDQGKYSGQHEQTKQVPVLGTIACGTPILAQEYIEGYEQVSVSDKADFVLRAKGDSMIGVRILDGDLVFIRQQPDVESGEIAAVLIDGDEATLKRVHKVDGAIILRAENPTHEDIVFSKKDTKRLKIIGKAIYFKSEVR